jgi:GT2 family glycosyltransferase
VKVLSPAVTILLTSHLKPCLGDALDSVVAQTRRDFECVVLDSGLWIGQDAPQMAAIYERYSRHPLIEWVTTGEREGLASRVCPVAWVTNQAIRAGLARGEYMCTFYDDDRYYPLFMEKMAGYLDEHPEAGAVWCSQNRVNLGWDGTVTPAGYIPADGPKSGAVFDCAVDGAQVMWRTELLAKIGDPWLPEAPDDGCRHSDGLFLNKLGTACGVVPAIGEVLVEHRFTRWSTYTPFTG